MTNVLWIFIGVVCFKVLVNASKYVQCKRYLHKYLDWVKDPDWELAEHKSRVIKLLKDAGVKDGYRPVVDRLSYGHVNAWNASVMENFPTDKVAFFVVMRTMFHEAIGVYRSRILETFNPLYWIELLINLPRNALGYLGVSPESLLTRIAQFIWWIVGVVLTFLYAMYRPELEALVRDWVGRLSP